MKPVKKSVNVSPYDSPFCEALDAALEATDMRVRKAITSTFDGRCVDAGLVRNYIDEDLYESQE